MRKKGFEEKPYETFDNLLNEGEKMFELAVPSCFTCIHATAFEAIFVCMFYAQNIEALHGKDISLEEWKEILSKDDTDEQNFIIYKGEIPVAWLRVNGLQNKETAWISMLVVSDKWHRQGIGTFAVGFAERFIKSKGFSKVGIHTTEDNIPAQNLYKKCGYAITEYGDCTTGDGIARKGYTFEKNLKEAM